MLLIRLIYKEKIAIELYRKPFNALFHLHWHYNNYNRK